MSKRPTASCPNPQEFVKWWRNRANHNADELSDAGKPMRAYNFTVTEEQVNSRFKLLPASFKPGQLLAKLQDCGIPCYDMKPEEFMLGWSPKQFDKLQTQQVESANPP